MVLDADSKLQEQWIERVRGEWAGHRAAASVAGSDGAAWLDGDAAEAFGCDASISPVVFGEVNPAVLDDLVRLCLQLARYRHGHGSPDPSAPAGPLDPTGSSHSRTRPPPTRLPWTLVPRRPFRSCCPPRPGSAARLSSAPSSARLSPWSRAQAGWPASCAASSSAPAWPARAF